MDERVWEKTAQFLKELRCEDTGRLSQLQLPEYQKAMKMCIRDRNGKVLAGKGVASSVGLVPGKIQDKENTIIKLAELLEVDIDVIKNLSLIHISNLAKNYVSGMYELNSKTKIYVNTGIGTTHVSGLSLIHI